VRIFVCLRQQKLECGKFRFGVHRFLHIGRRGGLVILDSTIGRGISRPLVAGAFGPARRPFGLARIVLRRLGLDRRRIRCGIEWKIVPIHAGLESLGCYIAARPL
jgi:hypothetical protein